MLIAPEAIIDTLNGLLEGHVNSLFHYVLQGSPYLGSASSELRRLLVDIDQVCNRQRDGLARLIESIGGTPRAQHRVAPDQQYLSFLSLKFLLPTLVNEKDLLLTRYENARAAMGDVSPAVVEFLKRTETEQCICIEKLKTAASEVTGGKFEPPQHSQKCEEAAR